MKFKVVQLNIWLGQFLEETVDFLLDQNADVVCLQEVTSGGYGEFAHGKPRVFEQLLEKTGYNGVFAPMWEVKTPNVFEMGVAILSKHKLSNEQSEFYFKNKIFRKEGLTIGKPGSIEFPGLLLNADVEIGGKIFKVKTTHFLWSMFPETTKDQVDAINKLTEKIDGENDFILTGDFNVTDKSVVYKKLIDAGFTDDRPENTLHTLHPTIHKVGSKEIAVDFVFHKGENFKILNTSVPVVPVSDHLPVVVEYEIKN